jgi:hypothetical protein
MPLLVFAVLMAGGLTCAIVFAVRLHRLEATAGASRPHKGPSGARSRGVPPRTRRRPR